MIQHFLADPSDQSLGMTVGLRGPVRSQHDLYAFGRKHGIFGRKHGIEAASVLRIAVANQEPQVGLLIELLQIHN